MFFFSSLRIKIPAWIRLGHVVAAWKRLKIILKKENGPCWNFYHILPQFSNFLSCSSIQKWFFATILKNQSEIYTINKDTSVKNKQLEDHSTHTIPRRVQSLRVRFSDLFLLLDGSDRRYHIELILTRKKTNIDLN